MSINLNKFDKSDFNKIFKNGKEILFIFNIRFNFIKNSYVKEINSNKVHYISGSFLDEFRTETEQSKKMDEFINKYVFDKNYIQSYGLIIEKVNDSIFYISYDEEKYYFGFCFKDPENNYIFIEVDLNENENDTSYRMCKVTENSRMVSGRKKINKKEVIEISGKIKFLLFKKWLKNNELFINKFRIKSLFKDI